MISSRSRPNHPHWIGIALAFYAFISIGIAEGGLGVLLPSILETYHLTSATVTVLFISQVTGYAIGFLASVGSLGSASIPTIVGWVADRAGLEIIPAFLVPLAIVMIGLHRWLVHHSPSEQVLP